MFLILLFFLQLCIANFIVSYDSSSIINIINYDSCFVDHTIYFNKKDATYSSDLMIINVSHLATENNALKATIKLNNDTDEYTFIFFDNGDYDLHIYKMFKYLTIYKNNILIGTTYVADSNITILTPNASYFINQDTYSHCPLYNIYSYYCIEIDSSIIPEKVMYGGLAVSLPWNYPQNSSFDIVILVLPMTVIGLIIVFIISVCCCKKKQNVQKVQEYAPLLVNNSSSVVVA
jgi:hypothetical protein